MSLWQWEELLSACSLIEPVSGPQISGISLDSRTVVTGDLFVALSGDPGPRFHSSSSSDRDGHEFIQNAFARGAAAALVSREVDVSGPLLTVEDTLDGLWQLGSHARNRVQAKVTAITGSSGKTTARQWLEELLALQNKTHASVGSLNNHWGVPLSLARMPADSKFAVFEIGTNRSGEIRPLAELVSPDVALLLNVLPAHIGHFDNLEAIRREKLSIAKGLSNSGHLIVPVGLDLTGLGHTRRVTFGTTSNSDVFGEATYHGQQTLVEANVCGKQVNYQLSVGGEHRVLTSLAVLAAMYCLGADVDLAAASFSSLDAPRGRGNVISVAGVQIIDDSYNANPVSMAYGIRALQMEKPAGKRIALLGEMLELGHESVQSHADTATLAQGLDRVITVGEVFSATPGNGGHYDHV
ncbi:MAG TPA: UDP-N-acetylmuramoyl-tripeptide--D-alanyl-D-alanine ligase, partial [Pseudomonadales bacterium]|nr:UDP-N-acetylmuramoyl-tripeptide--D-alanyl-D-alanine ligase [Pseudomonadales bacterium]